MTKQEIFTELQEILSDKLNVEIKEITADKTLKDLGADSLDATEAIMQVEEDFDLAIPDHEMEKFTDIQSIVDYIFNNTNTK